MTPAAPPRSATEIRSIGQQRVPLRYGAFILATQPAAAPLFGSLD